MNGTQRTLFLLSLTAKIALACFLLLFQFHFLSSKYWNVVITLTIYRRKPQNTKKILKIDVPNARKKPKSRKLKVSLCAS